MTDLHKQLSVSPTPGGGTTSAKLTLMKKELTTLAVMIGLATFTAVLNPMFLGADNLRNTIRHISLDRKSVV